MTAITPLGPKNCPVLQSPPPVGMNEKSSRSHSIFQIDLKIKSSFGSSQKSVNCRASLIDLAGSERADRAGTTGQRLKEGASINKSLLTLGKATGLNFSKQRK